MIENYNTDPHIGFENEVMPPIEENNAFVSREINKSVDPNKQYNEFPFYGRWPSIILLLLLFAPLGLFLLWKFKRHSHFASVLIITIIFIFAFISRISNYVEIVDTIMQAISKI